MIFDDDDWSWIASLQNIISAKVFDQGAASTQQYQQYLRVLTSILFTSISLFYSNGGMDEREYELSYRLALDLLDRYPKEYVRINLSSLLSSLLFINIIIY